MKQRWEIQSLSDIATIMYGYTAKAKSEPAKTKYLRITDIQNNKVDWDTVPFCDLENNEYSKYYLKYGDIVFARTGATTGKSFLLLNPPNAVFASYLIRVQANLRQILPEFLYQYFQTPTYWDVIKKGISGSAQGGFNATKLGELKIPIPPIDEQKRIVAKLDQCFEAIEKARINVEKNLKNAKELFQSQLNQILSQKGKGWAEKRLGEVCIVERGSSPRPIKDYLTESEDGVNWVKIGDTKNVEKYIYKTKQKITKEGAKKSRFVDVGDFILTNSMTYGKPYIMKTQGYIHDGWFVLRLPDEINSELFWYLLASPNTMEQFEYLAAGAIVKNISGDLVKKAILPIPPIGEQASIVEKLDSLSAQIQSLELKYQQELDALNELIKSILQKAFAGELI